MAASAPTGVVGADTITTIAGNGTTGFSGDHGPATLAQLRFPPFAVWSVAVDGHGNVYIADTGNQRVRKVSAGGTITTIAGTGVMGVAGDGGPATSAQLFNPASVAVDGAGNVYIGDGVNASSAFRRVRRVSANGTITTVAGGGANPISDGVPAASVFLSNLFGVAADGLGNIFIADGTSRLHKVDAGGTITTVAGTGVYGFSGDGGPATSAQIGMPFGVAADGLGNVFFADYAAQRVRRVDAGGTITTVAGNGILGFAGDGQPGTSAKLCQPVGVAADRKGNVYISDSCNQRVRKVDAAGIITTVAGGIATQVLGDGGHAAAAFVAHPAGVAVDTQGSVLIADTQHIRIRKVWKVPLPSRPATGGSGVVGLRSGANGHGFRVRVALRVPSDCHKACKGRAELRVRSGHATYPAVALPGDGKVVLGTRHGIGLGGHATHTFRFFITVSRAKLLHTHFTTHGGFRVANTRLRIWFTKPGGEVLLVRDGRLRISIAKIRSGALPKLKHIL